LSEENDTLYGELSELGLQKKSPGAEQPIAVLKKGKQAEALKEKQQRNLEIMTLHNDNSKLLDRCGEIINKNEIAHQREKNNEEVLWKYETSIKNEDMEEMKRLSVEAFDEIKFELRKYHRSACNLNLLEEKYCQILKPRLEANSPYSPNKGFSDLQNQLSKSQQIIKKLTKDCLHLLTVSKSEMERLKIWVREHLIFDNEEGNSHLMKMKLTKEKSLSYLSNLKQQIEIICSKRRHLTSWPDEKVEVVASKVKSFELELRGEKTNCQHETSNIPKPLIRNPRCNYSESSIGSAHPKNKEDDGHLN